MKSIHTVYVQNKDGSPLMPTRPAKAKWLIKNGKAKVVEKEPFTIRLTYQIKEPVLQPTSLVIDDGETVGVAVLQHNKTHQRVVFSGEMRLRGRDIADSLATRKRLRRARRKRGWKRKPKVKARTSIPASIRADVEAKLRLVRKITLLLPISQILWESLSFSISPSKKRRYKPALARGLDDELKMAVLERDGCRCCICNKSVAEENAIIYRISGRTNRYGNLISLCPNCYERVNNNRLTLSLDTYSLTDTRGACRCMGGKNEFGKQLKAMGIPIMLVNGWRTQQCREKMGLDKTHVNDAIAIGSKGERCWLMDSYFFVRLRKRHQRKLFFENPGDRDIQKALSNLAKRGDAEYSKRFRGLRRNVRRRLYAKRYGKGGNAKQKQLSYRADPFMPNEAIFVKKDHTRGVIKNRKIYKDQELPEPPKIDAIFRRGDVVKTEEGELAEVVTLFSDGKVGIRFIETQVRTARIPEKLQLFARGKSMQFYRRSTSVD